jgi:hypothetical protein
MANAPLGRDDEDRYSGQFAPGFSRIHEDSDLLWVVPFRVRYILGVAGYRFTGKSSALNHLAERHGFQLYTLSMTLRQLADELGQSKSPRKELQDLGDRLRREHQDQGVLARLTLRRIRADHLSHQSTTGRSPRIAVGGFKHPEEVKVFSRIPEFRLMALTIPDTAERYARGRDSGAMHAEVREAGGDPSQNLFEQFKPLDERDLRGEEGGDDFGQAVEEVVKAVPEADRIDNAAHGTEELRRKLDHKVRQLDLQYRLPRGH